jgi:hypothetical protein
MPINNIQQDFQKQFEESEEVLLWEKEILDFIETQISIAEKR